MRAAKGGTSGVGCGGIDLEYKEHRRKHKRYKVRWKAAVVFDRSSERPVLHTETFDLSMGGGAIRTEYGDLTKWVVTLLLAQPPRQPGEQPRMLKIQALVVSTAQTPGKSSYRHGMSFIRSPTDGIEGLEELLQTAGAAGGDAAEPATVAPAPAAPAVDQAAPSQAAPVGRLAALKQAAQAKLAEEAAKPKIDPQKERDERVSEALKRAYWYFKDMVEQLDVLKPAIPDKGYTIPGVPMFSDFAWDAGKLDMRAREVSRTVKLFTKVSLDFRLSKQKPMLKVEREFPGCEKLKQLLKDYKVDFTSSDTRNTSGAIVKSTFGFPCEVVAKLEFEGNFDTGRLLLKLRNVERFGMIEHIIAPESVTQESLEELTGFILGETSKVGPLILKNT